ncbi:heparinase II/III family protein [Pyxidicoccus xibeiensis]|uniref:heparinase II/III family protein n=1 Tax=Pyxidicoccus xibeiensis TaxID=2906759 RepID=UPI0020A78FB5|nr:alginate lyase family protein [Pyxidicoccus xibeiensis]MCP3144255.1 heparinase II/III family protein [Pyxidicoccus xibeiensis]
MRAPAPLVVLVLLLSTPGPLALGRSPSGELAEPSHLASEPLDLPDCEQVPEACLPRAAPSARELVYAFLDEGTLADADLILQDRWPVPRFEPVQLSPSLTWTEDPFNEKYWRFTFYGLRPTRHLLWAWRQTGDVRYRAKLLHVLEGFAQRGHQSGFAWDKHTAAFRAMVLVNTYVKLLSDRSLKEPLAGRLRLRIQELGAFLRDPENFEEDYNHGLAQAGALLLIAENFPGFDASPEWRATAVARLDLLLDKVLDADGVEVEQSPFYHFYFLTGFWQLYHWAQMHGVALSANAEPRIRQMLRYATHIVLPDGDIPMIGSSVERNIRRSQDTPLFQQMAAIDPRFAYVLSAGAAGTPPLETRVLFPSSGQAVLRSSFGAAKNFKMQTHVIFDVGPYRTLHSHLDALAVHLYSAGRTLLPDSGHYTNEPETEGYDYFRGTRAHNTVVVDGGDQREGTAKAGLSTGGVAGGWAYQSGSHTLYDGVLHKRAVALLRQDLVLVLDDLSSETPHAYDQTWNLFPEADLQVDKLRAKALDPVSGKTLLTVHQLLSASSMLVSVRKGHTVPLEGWHSARFEQKVPGFTLRWRKVSKRTQFATLLASGAFAEAGALPAVAERTPQGYVATVCIPDGRGFRLTVVDLAGPGERATLETLAACPLPAP